MDPQQNSDGSQTPQDNTNTSPAPGANDISMSEETTAKPGSVVTGGQPSSDVPTPPASQDSMPAFMKDPITTNVPPAPVAKKKMALIVAVIAAVLLLGGGAAAYYFGYMVPNKPANILKSALVNSFSKGKVTSAAFDGNVTVSEKSSSSKFLFDFSGAAGEDGKLNLSGSLDAVVTKITFDLRSLDGKTFYAKLGGLSGLPELLAQRGNPTAELYAPLLANFNDQWYEINESLIQQLTGSKTSSILSDDDRQKLAQAYQDNQFLVVSETLASEKINGTDSNHYKVIIDGSKLQGFISAVQAANIQSLGITGDMFTSIKDNAGKADFAKYPLEVWVAKDSKLFTQFTFHVDDTDAVADIRLTFKDYNKPVSVEKPEGAKSLLEAISAFYQSYLGVPIGTNGISL